MNNLKRLITFLMLAICLVVQARQYGIKDIPNVSIEPGYNFVSDPENLLSPKVKDEVNLRIKALTDSTTAEMAVVVVPSIDTDDIEGFATDLFKEWGIGKKGSDNGVLLLIATEDRAARIEVGYGVEGIITDMTASKVMRQVIIPLMKENDLDGAVSRSVDTMAKFMESGNAREELRARKGSAGEWEFLDDGVLWIFLCCVVGMFLTLDMGIFFNDISRASKLDSHHAALLWYDHQKALLVLVFLTAGLGLIFYLLSLVLARRARNKRVVCSTCGQKMKKLSEKDDNAYLSGSQDWEEQHNTVDYDVWLCPECGTVERFPYRVPQKKYTECKHCHTVARRVTSDTVVHKPTTQRSGQGMRVYECTYCGHKATEYYRIPAIESGSAIAGAAVGAALGGGGGGGGGFGGFGGGSSGGGGATGRW